MLDPGRLDGYMMLRLNASAELQAVSKGDYGVPTWICDRSEMGDTQ